MTDIQKTSNPMAEMSDEDYRKHQKARYISELAEDYRRPHHTTRDVNEWMDALYHGNQSDGDIMGLVSERDDARLQVHQYQDLVLQIATVAETIVKGMKK